MNKDHKASLIIYGLDKMSKEEILEVRTWLLNIVNDIQREDYAKLARFKLMK